MSVCSQVFITHSVEHRAALTKLCTAPTAPPPPPPPPPAAVCCGRADSRAAAARYVSRRMLRCWPGAGASAAAAAAADGDDDGDDTAQTESVRNALLGMLCRDTSMLRVAVLWEHLFDVLAAAPPTHSRGMATHCAEWCPTCFLEMALAVCYVFLCVHTDEPAYRYLRALRPAVTCATMCQTVRCAVDILALPGFFALGHDAGDRRFHRALCALDDHLAVQSYLQRHRHQGAHVLPPESPQCGAASGSLSGAVAAFQARFNRLLAIVFCDESAWSMTVLCHTVIRRRRRRRRGRPPGGGDDCATDC